MRLLAIDAGNTRVKWGLHDGSGWVAGGAVPKADAARLGGEWRDAGPIDRVAVANVAGAGVAAAIRAALPDGLEPTWVRSSDACCGVRNGYADPRQLGCDRWAMAVAAWRRMGRACLVAGAGTALTVDTLSGEGAFRGGIIVPGLDLMKRALDANTDALRLREGHYRDFPDNTADAIASGAIQALAGAVERMAGIAGMAGARAPGASHSGVDGRAVPCLLTGGAAALLAPHLRLDVTVVDNLVLEGVLHIALAELP